MKFPSARIHEGLFNRLWIAPAFILPCPTVKLTYLLCQGRFGTDFWHLVREKTHFLTVNMWATNSAAIEANQTLLRIRCYMPLGGNEAIQGLCKMLAGLPLVNRQQQLTGGTVTEEMQGWRF